MKIQSSKRGLTFSLSDDAPVQVGQKYRYVLDVQNNQLHIIPDAEGKYTVSKKKVGKKVKPLFDLRNKEVREFASKCDYLDIVFQGEGIVVHSYTKSKSFFRKKKAEIISIEDLIRCGKKKSVVLTQSELVAAVGSDAFHQVCIDEWLQSRKNDFNRKELQQVFDVVSLFSGAGMLDYPFHKDPSFRVVFGCDFDKSACESYRENIGDHIVQGDIRALSETAIPDASVIIGGPCCQGFSSCNRKNKRSSAGKEKRDLVNEYIRIVRHKRPDVFVIENVPEFLTEETGSYLERVLTELSDYAISYSIVKDSSVGGFTKRKRAIVIGSLIGKIELPNINVLSKETIRDVLGRVNAEWFNYEDISAPKEETQIAMSYVRPGYNFRDIPKDVFAWNDKTHSIRYRRLSWDETEAPALPNWRKAIIMPPEGNRILSVAEAAALMGLDKNFKFLGTLNDRQQQVGNGVPQKIAELVKNTVKKALTRHYALQYQFI